MSNQVINNKKKVLYLITKGNFGGAQRYVYDLATSLPKNKYESVVACGEGEELEKKLNQAEIRTIKIDGLVREVSFFDEFKVCLNLFRLIREERPNVIHLNSSKIGGIGAVAGRLASLFTKKYSPRIIFTSHGWGFYDKYRSNFEKIFFYISHWLTVLLSHKTIAVSGKTRRDMIWLPFMKKRMVVIHNGLEEFKLSDRVEARQKLAGEAEEKTIIFSISELHRNKGLDIALEAIFQLPKETKEKIIYSIAGLGEEKENLEKLVEKFGLGAHVRFLGFLPEAKSLLSGADIFLFPSRTENLPFAVLEAGFASLPIVATSVGGIPEIITDMKNGILVHKENPKEIREAIEYMLKNHDRALEFSKKIHTTVSKNFSKKKMISETFSLYS